MDKAKSNKQASKRRSTVIAVAIRETNKRLRPSSEPECTVSQPIADDQNMPSENVDAIRKKRGFRETNKRLCFSSEPECTMSQPKVTDDQNVPSNNVDATRKKRGPTQVKMVSENNYQKIELEFNEFGQVIGRNSENFVSLAGALVREYVPVVIKTWPFVDVKKKLELWNFLQQRFNVSDCHQKMIFQCMGTYWRTYKSRLRKQIKLQVPSAVNKKCASALLRPKNINCEAWEKFVEDTLSTDFQKKSSKFINMRTNQKLLHTMGRKGYSCTAHDLSLQGSGTEEGIVPMENARCQLLHWYMFEEEEVVGEGKIASIDPIAKVHHIPLGCDCWKVWLEEVYMSNLPLYRPNEEF